MNGKPQSPSFAAFAPCIVFAGIGATRPTAKSLVDALGLVIDAGFVAPQRGASKPQAHRRLGVVEEGRLTAPRASRAAASGSDDLFAESDQPGDDDGEIHGEEVCDVAPGECASGAEEEVEDNLGVSDKVAACRAARVEVAEDGKPLDDKGKRRCVRQRKRDENYRRYKIHDFDGTYLGVLLYNENSTSMDAHSEKHGISTNRTVSASASSSGVSARGRPLGFLVAWVMAGLLTDDVEDLRQLRKGHHGYLTDTPIS
jgi:hypothetical protein